MILLALLLVCYVIGIIFLVLHFEEVILLPWNKNRQFQVWVIKTLVDILESLVWPYTLWRVYKLRSENR